ncbi:MAG: Ycf66 family protein [Halothece sp. Uz-M2-17]|nr:Ycf66 family protein [Halothece sp. Uz-M2-17]
MLAHILALAVALGSFLLYFSAFFFPEVHRKSDFYGSGLGLFYGLVLWVCAGRITGGILLGAMASTALLLWFGTQTLILRRALTAPAEKTNISQNIARRLQALSPQNLWQNIRGNQSSSTPKVEPSATESSQAEKEEVNRETKKPDNEDTENKEQITNNE